MPFLAPSMPLNMVSTLQEDDFNIICVGAGLDITVR
jgi:hypothetical protein